MKTSYKVFEIGSTVFVINRIHNEEKPTNYITIYEAVVNDVYIGFDEKTNSTKIEYGLKTPNGKDWGDSVSSDDVSDAINDLVQKMIPVWLSESNTFGD